MSSPSGTPLWRLYLLVAVGGALGGGSRYLLGLALAGADLPWPTLVANVIGSLLIGFYSALPATHFWTRGGMHLFVTAGICGGFTTFSVFSLEMVMMFQQQQWLYGVGWLMLSVTLWLGAVTLGYLSGKRLAAS
ncbi:CrcB family protein [Alcanivorax sp. 1008]|uniref:fluoride efflux transporter FluC n=1 Tax=Alcanivorax sp. 1008 TaxID=2816853 RepID=UPI001D59ECF4|nr:CrcB family protein [Alcanivorax sp. 1008]MCC1496036.1 CrcB family protein [Alcanivorax sp. 1008]